MSYLTLEGARDRYLNDLQNARPLFNDQMSDILAVLHSVLGEASPPIVSSLDARRADYTSCLLDQCRTFDERVLELAEAGNHLFAPALGLAVKRGLSFEQG
jgi:hypothetical protein